MIDAERREKSRLLSERWRRAHGIGPRRPAKQPWLAEGVSRSTWYRRRKQAQQAAFVCASLDRAESFAAALTRDLTRCAALERESRAIIEELTALAAPGIPAICGDESRSSKHGCFKNEITVVNLMSCL
jgi:hypothetical protein